MLLWKTVIAWLIHRTILIFGREHCGGLKYCLLSFLIIFYTFKLQKTEVARIFGESNLDNYQYLFRFLGENTCDWLKDCLFSLLMILLKRLDLWINYLKRLNCIYPKLWIFLIEFVDSITANLPKRYSIDNLERSCLFTKRKPLKMWDFSEMKS